MSANGLVTPAPPPYAQSRGIQILHSRTAVDDPRSSNQHLIQIGHDAFAQPLVVFAGVSPDYLMRESARRLVAAQDFICVSESRDSTVSVRNTELAWIDPEHILRVRHPFQCDRIPLADGRMSDITIAA